MQHGVNTRPGSALAEGETGEGETSLWQHIYIQAAVVWLLVHDFGLNRWWLWDFQLGPAPGCWGSIIEPGGKVEGTSHPSARR